MSAASEGIRDDGEEKRGEKKRTVPCLSVFQKHIKKRNCEIEKFLKTPILVPGISTLGVILRPKCATNTGGVQVCRWSPTNSGIFCTHRIRFEYVPTEANQLRAARQATRHWNPTGQEGDACSVFRTKTKVGSVGFSVFHTQESANFGRLFCKETETGKPGKKENVGRFRSIFFQMDRIKTKRQCSVGKNRTQTTEKPTFGLRFTPLRMLR